jgi:hypothetical protein
VRVRAAAADAARLDDLAGPLTAVTDRGQSVALKSDGISLEGDGGLLFAETEELDLRARVLKKVSGTLRAYPRAEKLRLELEGREGAEARAAAGLVVRVLRWARAGNGITAELRAEWPAELSLRGEAGAGEEGEAFTVTATGTEGGEPRRVPTEEVGQPTTRGRKEARIVLHAERLGIVPRAVVLEAVARSGAVAEQAVVLEDVTLPLSLPPPVPRAGAGGARVLAIPAPQRVLLNGKPAGGWLELQVAAARGTSFEAWRPYRVHVKEDGVAAFELPGPGRYRIQRRWVPEDADYARLLGDLKWAPAEVQVNAVAGQPATTPPLAATTSAIFLPQRVEVNGGPAGEGTLEVGLSTAAGTDWGPWRWYRLTTDASGVARFALPGPGRYRIQRRWSPNRPQDAPLFARATWQPGVVEVTAAAGKPVTLAPLSASGVPPAELQAYRQRGAGRGAAVEVLAGSIRQRAQGMLVYDSDTGQPRANSSRSAVIELEARAADDQSGAAVAGLTLTSVVLPDDSILEGATETLGPAREAAGRSMRVSVSCRRLLPEWAALKEISGELLVYDEALVPTLQIPLAAAGVTEFQQDRLRLRVTRGEDGTARTYTVEVQSPAGANVTLRSPEGSGAALLDGQKGAFPARFLRFQGDADTPNILVLTFQRPAAGSPEPALLRLPLLVRLGELRKQSFHLRDIPLPLAPPARGRGADISPLSSQRTRSRSPVGTDRGTDGPR